jgi:hypothetical protein
MCNKLGIRKVVPLGLEYRVLIAGNAWNNKCMCVWTMKAIYGFEFVQFFIFVADCCCLQIRLGKEDLA